jgi:hypothetical protein
MNALGLLFWSPYVAESCIDRKLFAPFVLAQSGTTIEDLRSELVRDIGERERVLIVERYSVLPRFRETLEGFSAKLLIFDTMEVLETLGVKPIDAKVAGDLWAISEPDENLFNSALKKLSAQVFCMKEREVMKNDIDFVALVRKCSDFATEDKERVQRLVAKRLTHQIEPVRFEEKMNQVDPKIVKTVNSFLTKEGVSSVQQGYLCVARGLPVDQAAQLVGVEPTLISSLLAIRRPREFLYDFERELTKPLLKKVEKILKTAKATEAKAPRAKKPKADATVPVPETAPVTTASTEAPKVKKPRAKKATEPVAEPVAEAKVEPVKPVETPKPEAKAAKVEAPKKVAPVIFDDEDDLELPDDDEVTPVKPALPVDDEDDIDEDDIYDDDDF